MDRSSEWEEKFIAELNGRPIGFLQIIDAAREETHYWGEVEEGHKAIDIWIGETDDLGKGYGTEINESGTGQVLLGSQSKSRAHRSA